MNLVFADFVSAFLSFFRDIIISGLGVHIAVSGCGSFSQSLGVGNTLFGLEFLRYLLYYQWWYNYFWFWWPYRYFRYSIDVIVTC